MELKSVLTIYSRNINFWICEIFPVSTLRIYTPLENPSALQTISHNGKSITFHCTVLFPTGNFSSISLAISLPVMSYICREIEC